MNYSMATLYALCLTLVCTSSYAFVAKTPQSASQSTHLAATPMDRRHWFTAATAGLATAVITTTQQPDAAHATYTAYTQREDDWKARTSAGQVQYSNARELRAQLREIAPANTESSKIFCPNGPSASVSPLMENKCGDRQAIPSVYGRTTDSMGNSIPGFSGGFYNSGMGLSSADPGGLPEYGFTAGRPSDQFKLK